MFPNTNLTMNPETNLIVLCARIFLSNSESSVLRSILAEPLDWRVLEQNAENHVVMPLVAYVLSHHVAELMPQDRRERLQERLVRAARNNLAWVQEWLKILKVLTEVGIPVISFKGPTLGLMAYRNLALREFTDLDLLIQPGDVLKTRDVLIRNGYVLNSAVHSDTDAALTHSSHRQISFVDGNREITVDLHWGLLPEMFPFQLEVGQLFESALVESHERVSFLSLSPEHSLLLLCAHGTKHCWSNLRWLCDVACHIQSNPSLDWDLCVRLAEPAGCELVFKHSLLLMAQVLGLELPAPIRQYASRDTKAHSLAETARTFLFRQNDDRSRYLDDRSDYMEVLRYRLAFAKGPRWRAGAALVLRRAFVPNEADWQRVRLPRPLYFLYYLIRPIRLAVERLPLRRLPRDEQ
jgi:Uncharacterised nucleotidyltransferase